MGKNNQEAGAQSSVGCPTFVFHAAQAGSASNADIVTDFAAGAGGDALDIHDTLIGYAAGSISSFVQLSEQNGDTIVLVDKNGTVGGASFIKMAKETPNVALDDNSLP